MVDASLVHERGAAGALAPVTALMAKGIELMTTGAAQDIRAFPVIESVKSPALLVLHPATTI